MQEIVTITGTFKDNLIAWLADASNGITDFFAKVGHFDEVRANKLCAGSTCVDEQQLAAILAGTNAGAPSVGGAEAPASQPVSSAGAGTTSTSVNGNTPPVIEINGANPATIQVGATYADLGATITGPQADLNLGIQLYVDGTRADAIQLDTTNPGTHSIDSSSPISRASPQPPPARSS